MDNNKNDKTIAAIGSIVTHLLLIIVFLGFKVKEPQLEEKPIEVFDVMLGEDDLGDGLGENVEVFEPQSRSASDYTNTSTDIASSEKSNTSTADQRIAVNPANTRRPNVNARNTNSRTNIPRASTPPANNTNNRPSSSTTTTNNRPKATLGARNSGSGVGRGSGSGQGESGVAGNQGSPYGSLAYSLGERRIVKSPNKYDSFSRNGTVRMTIYVDRQGRIVRHRLLSSTSNELTSLAVNKLRQIKFNASSQAPPEQQGTVTFKFKLK